MRDDIIDRLLKQVADINRQLKALQRLDVGGVSDHGALSGLSDNDHPQYALTANGVTNGDSHDHSGGDGAQIDHGSTGGLTDDDHTQYALLAGRSGGQRVTGIASTGYALEVYRNLASGSTNSAVLAVTQDNASDDQPALRVQQDASAGSVNAIEGYVGATRAYKLGFGNSAVVLDLDGSSFGTTTFVQSSVTSDAGQFLYRVWGSARPSTTMGQSRAGAGEFVSSGLNRFILGTIDSAPLHLGTNNTLAMTIDASQQVGIGSSVTSPQGQLHAHDGTGGFLFVTKTSITGTAQTIIPDGTGDVVYQVLVEAVWRDSAGNAGSRTVTLAPSGTNYIVDDGGSNVLTLAVAANGSVTVQRTAGSRTYHVALRLLWL